MIQIGRIHQHQTPARTHFFMEWLEWRGIKKSEFARMVGVDKSLVTKWASGNMPTSKNIMTIAEQLNIEPNDLFRHPNDDWLTRFFEGRKQDEIDRIKIMLEAAFPKTGTDD